MSVLVSDLVVSVHLQQKWQNSLQVLLHEVLCFYAHGVEQNGPESGASSSWGGGGGCKYQPQRASSPSEGNAHTPTDG